MQSVDLKSNWHDNLSNIKVDLCVCRFCYQGTLNRTLVQGKIVLCDSLSFGEGPIAAGAVGSVMELDQGFYSDMAFSFPFPISPVISEDSADILKYLNTTR